MMLHQYWIEQNAPAIEGRAATPLAAAPSPGAQGTARPTAALPASGTATGFGELSRVVPVASEAVPASAPSLPSVVKS
jgi:hypothetical protein